MRPCDETDRYSRRFGPCVWILASLMGLGGCGHVLPVAATFHGDANANITAETAVRGSLELKMPSAVDPGAMTSTVVRPSSLPAPCARIALIDVDGLLLNQNFGNMLSVGDNPLSRWAIATNLEALAAIDPQDCGSGAADQQPGRERHDL